MGTCTVAIKKRDGGIGDHVEVTADVTLSASYATGGDTLTIGSLGLRTLRALLLCGGVSNVGALPLTVVHGANEVTDPKIMARDAGTGAEVANASNNSTSVIRVIAKGDHAFG